MTLEPHLDYIRERAMTVGMNSLTEGLKLHRHNKKRKIKKAEY